MSSGMWFAVCIPKKEYEAKKCAQEKEKAQSKESALDKIDPTLVEEKPEKKEEEEIVTNADSKTDLQSEEKEKEEKKDENDDMVYFVDKEGPMEETLEEALQLLGIRDAVWTSGKNEKYHQVYFPCESGVSCDQILKALLSKGIGVYVGSTVGVLPCSVFYREMHEEYGLDAYDTMKVETKREMKGFKSMQQQFLKSVTARLTVAQVVESVRSQALLTFDYIMFAVLASMIAALGLLENSSVIIVASMLVSPLMGPIMAGTFGAVIRDRSLISMGIKSELVGLLLCIVIGLIFGLACGNFDHHWGPNPFPTAEMFGRGLERSLWVGVLIALPSGAGVALSILGGNAGSLVGVAISASLLPPAVNAGLLWGVAIIKHMKAMGNPGGIEYDAEGREVAIETPVTPPQGYKTSYFAKMDAECALLGFVSLCLTIVNILCIFVSAYAVLKIKEVAPYTSIPSTARFWKKDLKIARGYNKTVGRNEGTLMGKQLLQEWAQLNGLDPHQVLDATQKARLTQMHTLQDIMQDVEADDVYQTVIRNVPGGQRHYKRLASWPPPYDNQLYGDADDGYRRRAYTHVSPVKKAIRKWRKGGKGTHQEEEHGGITLNTSIAEEDHEVQLRHPSPRSPEAQQASHLLHRTLSCASPYSLWPQSGQRPLSNRFVVTRVSDENLPPLPPRYSRNRPFSPTQMESNI